MQELPGRIAMKKVSIGHFRPSLRAITLSNLFSLPLPREPYRNREKRKKVSKAEKEGRETLLRSFCFSLPNLGISGISLFPYFIFGPPIYCWKIDAAISIRAGDLCWFNNKPWSQPEWHRHKYSFCLEQDIKTLRVAWNGHSGEPILGYRLHPTTILATFPSPGEDTGNLAESIWICFDLQRKLFCLSVSPRGILLEKIEKPSEKVAVCQNEISENLWEDQTFSAMVVLKDRDIKNEEQSTRNTLVVLGITLLLSCMHCLDWCFWR